MATVTRGKTDKIVKAFMAALEEYETKFRGSEAAVYRQNPGSVRVRIIDNRFVKMSRSDRHDEVWDFLAARVGDDAMQDLSILLLLPRKELKMSLTNMDFEDPIPSRL